MAPLDLKEERKSFIFSSFMRLQWGIMKGNRICIMAWAQEIDRSISSASYHVQCIAGVCVISGAQADEDEAFPKVRATNYFTKLSQLNRN